MRADGTRMGMSISRGRGGGGEFTGGPVRVGAPVIKREEAKRGTFDLWKKHCPFEEAMRAHECWAEWKSPPSTSNGSSRGPRTQALRTRNHNADDNTLSTMTMSSKVLQ